MRSDPASEVHPLLQQTPLTVNPFIDLPKAPTLPPNYVTLPTTLPPSMLNSAPAASRPELPAYVTSASGFAAHPSAIIAQNQTLLDQITRQRKDAAQKISEWQTGITQRDLAEKRRKAPGWLDSENRLLEPSKASTDKNTSQTASLLDELPSTDESGSSVDARKSGDDIGAAMDRAFG
jgi:hypothetical protein